VERQMIEEYLMVGYEKNEIAQALGISRRTLYRRLHEYGFL